MKLTFGHLNAWTQCTLQSWAMQTTKIMMISHLEYRICSVYHIYAVPIDEISKIWINAKYRQMAVGLRLVLVHLPVFLENSYFELLVKRKWCKFKGLYLHSMSVVALLNSQAYNCHYTWFSVLFSLDFLTALMVYTFFFFLALKITKTSRLNLIRMHFSLQCWPLVTSKQIILIHMFPFERRFRLHTTPQCL